MKKSFLLCMMLCLCILSVWADDNITFADENVKAICVSNWDTDDDGELSMAEAAAVTDLDHVFMDKKDITSFDELQYFTGLIVIGDGAFSGSSLKSVTIPNSVKRIENRAYYECEGLTSVIIPNSVEYLGGGAFSNCIGLKSITIPSSVTSMGDESPFGGCSSLSSIVVDSGNLFFDSRNNCNAIIETSTNKLISGCKNTIIPEDVTCIGSYSFDSYSDLTSITIPEGLERIEHHAFRFCINLTSITFPNSMKYINDYAFESCSGLTSVVIPKGVEVGSYSFQGCSSLNTVTLNSGKIDITAFYACDNIITAYVNSILQCFPTRLFPNSTNIVYGESGGYAYVEFGVDEEYLNTYESPFNKEYFQTNNGRVKIPIDIGCKNVKISQIQFDFGVISYSDSWGIDPHISLAENENNKKVVEMDKERFDYDTDFGYSHTITLTDLGDGWSYDQMHFYRVLLTNPENTPIKGEDGNAVYITLQLDEDTSEGDFGVIEIRNIELSTPSAERINPSISISRKGMKIYLRDSGDFNHDDDVTVTDYAGIVRLAAGQGYDDQGVPEWVIKKASDVNEDGEITVTDVSGIVNIILYGNYQGHTSNAKARRVAKTSGAMLNIEPFTINRGETKEVSIDLLSAFADLSQCQFDLNLPEGLSLVSVNGRMAVYPGDLSCLADGCSHTVFSAQREDGTVRVVCLSGSNEAYKGTEGSIVRMKVVADKEVVVGTADIELTNVEFARTDASMVLGVGSIASVTIGNEIDGIASVVDSSVALKDVFSVDGIHKDRLSKGLNIVRHADGSIRKEMVR